MKCNREYTRIFTSTCGVAASAAAAGRRICVCMYVCVCFDDDEERLCCGSCEYALVVIAQHAPMTSKPSSVETHHLFPCGMRASCGECHVDDGLM